MGHSNVIALPSSILGADGQPIQDPFKLYTSKELQALRGSTKWIVKHLIPDKGVGSIYGPSRSGKSFLSIDLLASLTHPGLWFGRKIHPRYTIYMPYEGVGGVPARDLAWELQNGRPTGIHYLPGKVNLRDAYQRLLMIDMFKRRGWWGCVFCVDTLAQAFAGIEENGSEMAEVLKVAQEISDGLSATVIIVHHTGHSEQERPRGWSGFFAGLDFAIACNIPEGSADKHDRTFKLAKVKDGEDGTEFGFTLKTKVLDEQPDEDGDWATSLVALPRELKKGKAAETKEVFDPVRDAEDDKFIWQWASDEHAQGHHPSMSSMRAQVADMREKRQGITVVRIRNAIDRLKKCAVHQHRLVSQEKDTSPTKNPWLLAMAPCEEQT